MTPHHSPSSSDDATTGKIDKGVKRKQKQSNKKLSRNCNTGACEKASTSLKYSSSSSSIVVVEALGASGTKTRRRGVSTSVPAREFIDCRRFQQKTSENDIVGRKHSPRRDGTVQCASQDASTPRAGRRRDCLNEHNAARQRLVRTNGASNTSIEVVADDDDDDDGAFGRVGNDLR